MKCRNRCYFAAWRLFWPHVDLKVVHGNGIRNSLKEPVDGVIMAALKFTQSPEFFRAEF